MNKAFKNGHQWYELLSHYWIAKSSNLWFETYFHVINITQVLDWEYHFCKCSYNVLKILCCFFSLKQKLKKNYIQPTGFNLKIEWNKHKNYPYLGKTFVRWYFETTSVFCFNNIFSAIKVNIFSQYSMLLHWYSFSIECIYF